MDTSTNHLRKIQDQDAQVAARQIVHRVRSGAALLARRFCNSCFPKEAGVVAVTLVHKVKKIIEKEKLIEPGERVLVGLSGGIDSTVMLYLLFRISEDLSFDLGVAHINHLLRGEESERDEEFVRNLAESLSLACHVGRIDVKREAGEAGKSLQHAGRDARYGFFRETAAEQGYQKIAVAHTLDDQVETFVMRMLKGTGLRGLSAIPVKRDNIVRPLLTATRAQIEEYGRMYNVSFVHDSSNEKTVYERNFVRKRIIPLMEELNPAFREKVSFLLNDLIAVNRMFDARAHDFMKTRISWDDETASLGVEALKGLDEETRFRVMAHLLDQLEPGFIALREHMRQINNVLMGLGPNLAAELPHGFRVKKTYDRLTITKLNPQSPSMDILPVMEGSNRLDPFNITLMIESLRELGETPLVFLDPLTVLFDEDKLGMLKVRSFREGDRFVPLGMKALVKLKDFFISQKIPREKRRHIPLLLSDDHIIWVVGHRMDDRFKVTGDTLRKIRIHADPILSS
ncbi:MAG: tRNA lysidine(34) synthetase TilS [Syntrophobacterales bacterium]|nr:tRNA lysidine(34) synthetase TilS [Syntrophobacterales bacterium]